MKGILEFDLDNYDDKLLFEQYSKCTKFATCLTDITSYIRNEDKHVEHANEEVAKKVSEIRDMIRHFIIDRDIGEYV